jgi:hypothetical protein
VRDWVLHTYKTSGKIAILCILIFVFQKAEGKTKDSALHGSKPVQQRDNTKLGERKEEYAMQKLRSLVTKGSSNEGTRGKSKNEEMHEQNRRKLKNNNKYHEEIVTVRRKSKRNKT